MGNAQPNSQQDRNCNSDADSISYLRTKAKCNAKIVFFVGKRGIPSISRCENGADIARTWRDQCFGMVRESSGSPGAWIWSGSNCSTSGYGAPLVRPCCERGAIAVRTRCDRGASLVRPRCGRGAIAVRPWCDRGATAVRLGVYR